MASLSWGFCVSNQTGNPRGQRRDFEAPERRRMAGLRLFRKGVPQAQITSEPGVARQTVGRQVRQLRKGGWEALPQAGRGGRLPKLGAWQLRQLQKMPLAGPEAFGYPTPLWSCPRVAATCEAITGKSMSPGYIGLATGVANRIAAASDDSQAGRLCSSA